MTTATVEIKRLPIGEFIAVIAVNFAMVAFSIDAMLPALPEIASELTPQTPNHAQLVLTSFVLGMGIGTLFAGPLSDTFGRKKLIFAGGILYLIGAAWAAGANSMENMLAARLIQGLGVAGPRIVTMAIVRDLYAGREMAKIMSYAMMIFTLVPAVAPLLGSYIIAIAGWRAVFLAFMLFACFSIGWILLRQAETLPLSRRRAFSIARLTAATREYLSHRSFIISIVVQAMIFGMLFACLSSTQQIFEIIYNRAESFPVWFAIIALFSGISSIINAKFVTKMGMRWMISSGLIMQILIASSVLCIANFSELPFAFYVLWTTSVFFMMGLVIGNINALAMEPVGHIAGLAASIIGSVSTIFGALIAIPIGLAFNGTVFPLALGIFILAAVSFAFVKYGLPRT